MFCVWAGLERFVCVGRVRMFCVRAGLERFVCVCRVRIFCVCGQG